MIFNVCFADTIGFEGYDYWLTIIPDWKLEKPVIGVWSLEIHNDALDIVLDIVARRLTIASLEVVRSLGPMIDSGVMIYRQETKDDRHTVRTVVGAK